MGEGKGGREGKKRKKKKKSPILGLYLATNLDCYIYSAKTIRAKHHKCINKELCQCPRKFWS